MILLINRQHIIFATFAIRSAYHQIQIAEKEQKYTAFEANGKLCEFNRIPFGVKNGVAVFHKAIFQFGKKENIMDTFPYFAEHDTIVKAFLETINCNNFTPNESKDNQFYIKIQIWNAKLVMVKQSLTRRD